MEPKLPCLHLNRAIDQKVLILQKATLALTKTGMRTFGRDKKSQIARVSDKKSENSSNQPSIFCYGHLQGCEVAKPLLHRALSYVLCVVHLEEIGYEKCFSGQTIERVDVSEPASISAAVASRYAGAMFDLAKESKALPALTSDIDAIDAALAASKELSLMIASPLVSRDDQGKAVAALATAMGLSIISAHTLSLMAQKRRLFVLPQLTIDVRARIAAENGEMTAEVTSAVKLTAAQAKKLSATLKASVGKDVKLSTAVDESLIGGLIVKLGSTMIDNSIKSKLAALQNKMKEVG